MGIDTPIIIYLVEAHPKYDALVIDVFQRIADNIFSGVTSVVTLIEVLIQPLKQRNVYLQREYQDLLLHSASFETMSIDTTIAECAAELRARYNLRIPDALQIATA